MIEALRHDEIIEKVGGRFKLTSLIQKRWLEIMRGARPLVDTAGKTHLEVVIDEILQGKVVIEPGTLNITKPESESGERF